MKKEKKAVVKNSQYYYKKAGPNKWLYLRGVIVGSLGLAASLSYHFTHKIDYTKELNQIKNESGYLEFIQEDLEILENQYNNGEISKEYYNDSKNEINSFKFEYYLKNKSDAYYLAKYEEIKKDADFSTGITLGLALAPVAAYGVFEITRMLYYLKKSDNLKKEEQQDFIEYFGIIE